MAKKWGVALIGLLLVSLILASCGEDKKDEPSQPKVELKQTLNAANGIQLRHPEGWAVREDAPGIGLANKEAYLSMPEGTEFPSDGMAFAVFAPMKLDEMGMSGTSTEDVLNSMLEPLKERSETMTIAAPTTLKVMGKDAIRADFTDSGNKSEGFFVAVNVDDNTVIVAVAVAHEGKLSDYNSTALAILDSITYTAPAS